MSTADATTPVKLEAEEKKGFDFNLLPPTSVFHACSDETLAKTVVVVMPPHESAKNMLYQVAAVPPSMQLPGSVTPEMCLTGATTLEGITTKPFPKPEFTLIPMKLVSQEAKFTGAGVSGGSKEDSVANNAHKYFLVATTEGLPPECAAFYGGLENMKKMQEEQIEMVNKMQVTLEQKRFYHTKLGNTAKFMKKKDALQNIDDVMKYEFKRAIEEHNQCSINANFSNETPQKYKGLSVKCKAFYKPKGKTPTVEENNLAIAQYKADAAEGQKIRGKMVPFVVNQQIVNAMALGFRPRRCPVRVRKGNMYTSASQLKNWDKSHVKPGDFVIAKLGNKIYANKKALGQTLEVDRLDLYYQGTKQDALATELTAAEAAVPEYQDEYGDEPEEEEQQQRGTKRKPEPFLAGGPPSNEPPPSSDE